MSGKPTEVINCPNCKEDVPKTLYCLNCGYPLYKLEQKKAEPEAGAVVETKPDEEVDMSVEINQPETIEHIIDPEEPDIETMIEMEHEEPEPVEEELEEEYEVIEEDVEPVEEPDIETTIEVEDEEPIEEEPMPEPEEEEPEPEPVIEEEQIEQESIPEPVVEPEAEKEVFTPEERETYMMNEIKLEFAPDPLTKEVMENLAKNITLKIRLVRLLRESRVKEETFKKLFDSYVEQGRLWVGRRDEIIRRFKADIERMEDELVTARKDFELLEIRKNIGDASEEEYNVKAPAYKWDIENLDKEINNTRGGIHYVINLKGLIPEEEVDELRAMADTDYSELDDVSGVTSDTIARMKESLAEALSSLDY